MYRPTSFKEEQQTTEQLQQEMISLKPPNSSDPSCVSMKSETSMYRPTVFDEPDQRQTEPASGQSLQQQAELNSIFKISLTWNWT